VLVEVESLKPLQVYKKIQVYHYIYILITTVHTNYLLFLILGDTNILDFLDELVENPPPAAEIANTGRSATKTNVNATKPKANLMDYQRSK